MKENSFLFQKNRSINTNRNRNNTFLPYQITKQNCMENNLDDDLCFKTSNDLNQK